MRTPPGVQAGSFPRPTGALRWVLIVLFSLWLAFALTINWMGATVQGFAAELYRLLVLDLGRLAQGEIWRLVTAPLVHVPSGPGSVGHILTTLLLLYFFGAQLQSSWGNRRFLWVLGAAALAGELLQIGATFVLPDALARNVAQPTIVGAYAAALACPVAWGATYRNATMYLFFAVAVRGWTIVIITVALALLNLVAADHPPPEGMLAPFGGMLVGYLLGGSTPSPLRKAFLRWKLRKLEGPGRPKGGGRLRVVPGGREGEPKRDGRWLN
ncbi:MAG TPA: rhomboid family intramembrane serine protease [Polyangiaceae bacterium]|nr:rhomboid family intramembrane serine protease [Polyangiaceae bacterium]